MVSLQVVIIYSLDPGISLLIYVFKALGIKLGVSWMLGKWTIQDMPPRAPH